MTVSNAAPRNSGICASFNERAEAAGEKTRAPQPKPEMTAPEA